MMIFPVNDIIFLLAIRILFCSICVVIFFPSHVLQMSNIQSSFIFFVTKYFFKCRVLNLPQCQYLSTRSSDQQQTNNSEKPRYSILCGILILLKCGVHYNQCMCICMHVCMSVCALGGGGVCGTPSILMDTTLEKLGHDNNIYIIYLTNILSK